MFCHDKKTIDSANAGPRSRWEKMWKICCSWNVQNSKINLEASEFQEYIYLNNCISQKMSDPAHAGKSRVAERETLRPSSFCPRSRWANNMKFVFSWSL